MKLLLLSVLALVSIGGIAGCGDSGGPDPKVQTAMVDKAKTMREMFVKAGGDYDKLSAEDKAKWLKFCENDQNKAQDAWNGMKYGPGFKPAGARPPGQ